MNKTTDEIRAAAYGELVASMERAAGGAMTPQIVQKILRNPLGQAFAFWFREAVASCAMRGDDAEGLRMAELAEASKALDGLKLPPAKMAAAQIAYCKAKGVDARREFGKRTRSARESKGLTVEQVAESAGIKPSSLRRIEEGKYGVSIDVMAALQAALGGKLF